ncbi:MAG: proteobacterial dedicated sortase system histidine kinase [Gammaproteobacteria bacterium]|nr:MAG: proteobacterial dedicated sortase system histidine kinase [Gammaproteobacteria bacterium]
MSFLKPRIGLRLKLVFLSSFLFAIPWLGYKYVWEMEKYLRKGQEQTLVGTVSAAATALHERPNLFNSQASFLSDVSKGRDLYAIDVSDPIQLDGELQEWENFQYQPHYYGDDYVLESNSKYNPSSLSFNHMVVKYEEYLYVMFEVIDDYIVYRKENNFNVHRNDNIQVAFLDKEDQFQRYIISNENPGWINAYLTKPEVGSVYPIRHESKIQGNWVETPNGYNVELRIPLEMIGSKLGFAIYDVDSSRTRKIDNIVGTSATQEADQLGTVLVPSPEIEQILKGLARSNSRIWVIDAHRRVLARMGDIRSATGIMNDNEVYKRDSLSWWQRTEKKYLHPIYYKLLTRPPQDFVDELEKATELAGSQIDDAILGEVKSSWYLTPDKKAVVLSAAHPIWVDEKVLGVVVAEETTNGIRTIRNKALERLFSVILGVMLLGTLALFLFASRISYRIRKLRSQAEQAIDEQGRIHTVFKGSGVNDEIGDLSRSFSSIVSRLGQYNSYLENMTSRLSHEFRTPVTVVRSSLDNLAMLEHDAEAKVYMERAQEGIKRLNAILTNMSEATRLEHSLQLSEKEVFNLSKLVQGCTEGYRAAYNEYLFETDICKIDLQVNGVPENISQLIDKVVANAVEFSNTSEPIKIMLSKEMGQAKLTIINNGPLLSQEMQGRLFESMVSVREQSYKKESGQSEAHLGIGLYIARLIAEFHQGHITIENTRDQSGVIATIWLPIITTKKLDS